MIRSNSSTSSPGLSCTSSVTQALRVWVTPPTTKCANAEIRSLPGRDSSVSTWRPDSIAKNASESRRLRITAELATCAPNINRPIRGSDSMIRTMLAIPARFCSSAGADDTAA